MSHHNHRPQRFLASVLALTFLLSSSVQLAFAVEPNIGDPISAPVNSVNDGYTIAGGTYANTDGGKTLFMNSHGNGLYLHSGQTVRGVEVDSTGNFTGNGGFVHFWAPGQVIRLDGNVNVNGVLKGGRVLVDSAYLYQNGQIFANGASGGSVQFNVGAATFGPNARIEAKGSQQANGQITINAVDFVDFQSGSSVNTLVTAAGNVLATLDSNHINVEAGLVNVEGVIQANGAYATPDGGTIRVVANGNSSNCFGCTLDTVRVVSNSVNGLPIADDVIFTDSEINTLVARRDALFNGSTSADGDAYISAKGRIVANGNSGSNVGNGGTITVIAANNVINQGAIIANGGNGQDGIIPTAGGNGGLVALTADHDIYNGCTIQANGGNGGSATGSINAQDVAVNFQFVAEDSQFNNVTTPAYWENLGVAQGKLADASARTGANGGNGGAIALSNGGSTINTGSISANGGNGGNGLSASASITETGCTPNGNAFAAAMAYGGDGGDGGNGGLIVFSNNENPTGNGQVSANGGNGGKGGDAYAFAKSSAPMHAGAYAQAIAGNGGQGGQGGNIVAPVSATFGNSQHYSIKDGIEGHSGDATAIARGGATDNLNGNIPTWMGHAIADAQTGNFGKANADAKAVGNDAARARANAVTGNQGEAVSIAKADGKWYTYADSDSNGGDYSVVDAKSIANATGYYDAAPIKGAYATSDAHSGYQGTANADASAKSYVFENQSDYKGTGSGSNIHNTRGSNAEAIANATSGNFGSAHGKAYAEGQQFIKAVANGTAGYAGMACADADAIQKGYEYVDPLAVANAQAGDFGSAEADAYAHGNWDSHALSDAKAGLAGHADAKSYAYSFANVSEAKANALTGNYGVSNAVSEAYSDNRDKDSRADATAKTGYAGRSTADATAKTLAGWAHKGIANATALFDTAGYGKAKATTSSANPSTATATVNGTVDVKNGTGVKTAQVLVDTMPVVTAPVPTSPVAPPVPVNHAVLQNTGNELLVHNNTAVLMATTGTEGSLNTLLNTATTRTVNQQTGGATLNPGQISQLVADNNTSANLTLDQTGFNALNALTVQNKNTITNNQVIETTHNITLQSHKKDIINTGTLASGNIALTAAHNVANSGHIDTHNNVSGGSIIIKAGNDVTNQTLIASNGTDAGGQVQIRAGRDIVNTGSITANGIKNGGTIVAKSGQYTINTQLLSANADNGRAGYVQLHGNNVALNTGDIEAEGCIAGGKVLLTAGDNDQSNNNRGADISAYIANASIKGFSDTALTPPVTTLNTTINTTLAESAINTGNISTKANTTGGDGKIYIAGNNQFGLAHNSTLNGVAVDVDGILSAPKPSEALQTTMSQVQNNGGHVYAVVGQAIPTSKGTVVTAVEAVACNAAPGGHEPDVNPNNPHGQGSEFPDDFTLPDPQKPDENIGYEVLGLFQQRRPGNLPPEPPRRLKLRLDDSKMFTASAYQSVTEEILALALDEYNRVLSTGQTVEEANRQMKLYLLESGISPAVAYTLMDQATACTTPNVKPINNVKLVDNRDEFGQYVTGVRVKNGDEVITQVAVADETNTSQTGVERPACQYRNTHVIVLKALAEIAQMPNTEKGRENLLLQ